MTMRIETGGTLIVFFLIVLTLVVLLMIFKQGKRRQKITSLVILIAAFAVLYLFFGRGAEIRIDSAGIESTAYGGINFEWDDIIDAEIIENYRQSGWKPVIKLNGSSFPGFKTGRFRLANKENAKILTQKSEDAVIFRTDEELYLFAVDQHDKFIDYVSEWIKF